MKMYKFLIVGFAGVITTGISCHEQSGHEITEEFVRNLCSKITNCARKQRLENLSPGNKTQMLPSMEKCLASQKKARQNSKGIPANLTADQAEKAKNCMRVIEDSSCSDLQKASVNPECQKFSPLISGI